MTYCTVPYVVQCLSRMCVLQRTYPLCPVVHRYILRHSQLYNGTAFVQTGQYTTALLPTLEPMRADHPLLAVCTQSLFSFTLLTHVLLLMMLITLTGGETRCCWRRCCRGN